MRKHLLSSIVFALILVGAGCFGTKTPPADTNTPVPSNGNVNAGTPGAQHAPVNKPATLGADVVLEIGDTASFADGLSVTLTKIDDSRCPKDVQCIWQGELAPSLEVSGGMAGAEIKVITLGTVRTLETIYAGYALSLREATDTSIKLAVTKDASTAQSDDRIRVTSPKSGALVTSPVTVTGEARGNWYFEASFPVQVLDANGKELAIVPAQARGEWMTENFVPFSVSLTFAKPATDTGTIVLHKDNPSGLPEHDASISIPVRFK